MTRPLPGAMVLAMACGLATACVTVEVRYLGADSADGDAAVPGPADPGPGDPGPADAAPETPAPVPATVVFVAQVGDAPLACGTTYEGLGTTAAPWEPVDFRLYVHDVRLLRQDAEVPLALDPDGRWQVEDVALLDFEDRTGACRNGTVDVNGAVRGTAPPGPYDGVRFKVGLPASLNHLDVATAPSPLNLPALYWGWTNGYKFARLDGRSGDLAFHFHLASIQCKAGTGGDAPACARLDVTEVELRGRDPTAVPVVLDFAALVAGADIRQNTPDTSPGCESAPNDADCVPLFEALGLDFDDGTADPARQTVFRWKS